MHGETIAETFARFNANNPKIYEHYKRYAFNWINTGAKIISSKQIIGRIRWFIYVETKSDDEFKINDSFTAHYARLFATDHPEHADKFNFRELRS